MSTLIRDIVRNATGTSHRHLDTASSRLDLSRPRSYAGFLRGQAEALFPLETALEAGGIGEILRDWPQRARTRALENDLTVLDVSCDPLPVPQFADIPRMFGAVYALEALRNGARGVLMRLARQNPESCVMGATRYLQHGLNKPLWPLFLAALESHPEVRSNPANVVEGAQTAFGMFESTLIPVVGIAAE
ncbi:MAG: biliverdin-producing heme oxygenase [Afipia sp.]